MTLTSANLALSLLCNGDCLYCPSDRGENIQPKIMPLGYAKKIVDEMCSEKFRSVHRVIKFEFGENGDAFLNPDVIEIMRYVKSHLPDVNKNVYTNFFNLTEEKSKIILKEGLLDSVVCNIDGADDVSYHEVKRLSFSLTRRNLLSFLRLRRELKADVHLTILSLTLAYYVERIMKLGLSPSKLRGVDDGCVTDDYGTIQEEWSKLIDPRTDMIRRPKVIGWAERSSIPIGHVDYRSYSCPLLQRVKEECFIAPDGTWYACCRDSKNELALGNVIEESILKVCEGERRMKLIRLLERGEFQSIGGPCRTVNCCQEL